ncbi:keratin-associated protein 13-1-like [Dugong dugon]
MSYNCCSGNFSSLSLGGCARYPESSCGSSSPSRLVYGTGLCSPRTIQLGSSVYRSCQETCCEPSRCPTACVVSSPCQMSCYRRRTSRLCSPCQTTYTGSLSLGFSNCHSLGYGSRSGYSLGCGSSGFRPLGHGFPFLGYGSRFCHPAYLTSRSFQSSCYRPLCGLGFYRSAC